MRMEASAIGNSDAYRSSASPDVFNLTAATIATNSHSHPRRFGMNLPPSNIFRSPLSALLEYSGIIRSRSSSSSHPDPNTTTTSSSSSTSLLNTTNTGLSRAYRDHLQSRLIDSSVAAPLSQPSFSSSSAAGGLGGGGGEVSIRIIGAGEQDHLDRVTNPLPSPAIALARDANPSTQIDGFLQPISRAASAVSLEALNDRGGDGGSDGLPHPTTATADTEAGDGAGTNNRDSPYQRYDIQQAARWIEQVLPFSLLLLVVFIRQHLQGFFVTIWIAAVMFKSNDILRKQTALKRERKISVLIGISIVFTLHVVGVYWWYRSDDLLYPFVMLPPKAIPPFWHAIFIIMILWYARLPWF